jgi:hypothetical protein
MKKVIGSVFMALLLVGATFAVDVAMAGGKGDGHHRDECKEEDSDTPKEPTLKQDCMSDGLGNRLCFSEEKGFTTVGNPQMPCIETFSEWIICRRPDGKWYKMVKEFIIVEAEENK